MRFQNPLMSPTVKYGNPFELLIGNTIQEIVGNEVPFDKIKVFTLTRGDRAYDFAVPLFDAAKILGRTPHDLATFVADTFPCAQLLNIRDDSGGKFYAAFVAAVAVDGYVNLTVDRVTAMEWLQKKNLIYPVEGGKTVCIDYSSPNIAKHLAYHHIRSTMLGHALTQIHRALGARVIGINHIGDWGINQGMLLAAFEEWGDAYEEITIDHLHDLYTRFRSEVGTRPDLEERARDKFKRLVAGEENVIALWKKFRDISLAEFNAIYDQLGVRFEDTNGESTFESKTADILKTLAAKNLLKVSNGASIVEVSDPPLIVATQHETSLYATRDLVAAVERQKTWHFDQMLYVVDRGQSLHFYQLFACLKLLGYEWSARCAHIPFGVIRFSGKKAKSRDSENRILLKEVFEEAVDRIEQIIVMSHPELSNALREDTAKQIGIGAVVFAILLTPRNKDIEFSWDRAISLKGDSGPYVQYTIARCNSLLRKGGIPTNIDWRFLREDAEWDVARCLITFGQSVIQAATTNEPHILAYYLLDLAKKYSYWYTQGNENPTLRIIIDDPQLRNARLGLVDLVRHVLQRGLNLLGIEAPDMM